MRALNCTGDGAAGACADALPMCDFVLAPGHILLDRKVDNAVPASAATPIAPAGRGLHKHTPVNLQFSVSTCPPSSPQTLKRSNMRGSLDTDGSRSQGGAATARGQQPPHRCAAPCNTTCPTPGLVKTGTPPRQRRLQRARYGGIARGSARLSHACPPAASMHGWRPGTPWNQYQLVLSCQECS